MASNKNASMMEFYSLNLRTFDKNSFDISIENQLYEVPESTKTYLFNSREAYQNMFEKTDCTFWSDPENAGFEIHDINYHLDGKVSIILKKETTTKRRLK